MRLGVTAGIGLIAATILAGVIGLASPAASIASLDGLIVRGAHDERPLTGMSPSYPCLPVEAKQYWLKRRSPETLRVSATGWRATARLIGDTRPGYGAMGLFADFKGADVIRLSGGLSVIAPDGRVFDVSYSRASSPGYVADCTPMVGISTAAGLAYPVQWYASERGGARSRLTGDGCVALASVGGKSVQTVQFGGCNPASMPVAVVNAGPTVTATTTRRGELVDFSVRACDRDSAGRGRILMMWTPHEGSRLHHRVIEIVQRRGCHTHRFTLRLPRNGRPYSGRIEVQDGSLVATSAPVLIR